MTLLEDHMWTISFSTADMLVSPKIIFNEGIGGSQTSDFDAVNKGVYTSGGFIHTGVSPTAANGLTITVRKGDPHHLSRGTRHQRGVCIRQIVPLQP